jgi:hypothetical protein
MIHLGPTSCERNPYPCNASNIVTTADGSGTARELFGGLASATSKPADIESLRKPASLGGLKLDDDVAAAIELRVGTESTGVRARVGLIDRSCETTPVGRTAASKTDDKNVAESTEPTAREQSVTATAKRITRLDIGSDNA